MAARVSAATEWAEKVAEEGPGALAKPPDAVAMVLDEHDGSSSEDTSDEAYQKMHQPMEVDEHNRLLGLTGEQWLAARQYVVSLTMDTWTRHHAWKAHYVAASEEVEAPLGPCKGNASRSILDVRGMASRRSQGAAMQHGGGLQCS
jgi:hypothetical protein